jgi:PKD repeat protein
VRGVDTVSGVMSFWSTTFSLLVIIEIIADFVGSPVEGWPTLTVNFTDLSTSTGAITSWDWDFGDGSPHSSVQNPSHDYSVAGFYTVTLIASDGISSDTTYKTDYIHVIVTIADFIGTPTLGITPLVVQFIDQSIGDPTSWDWDFGDGSPHSSVQNPVHIYNEADTYDVTLKIKKYGITNEIVRSAYIRVISVDFLGVPLRGVKNLTVNFIDLSVGVFDQWYWEFGDGYSSTEQNPVHYYRHPGEYTVSLMVTIEEKTFISIKQNYVLVSGDVTYDIAISPIRKAFLWGSGSVNKKNIGIEIKRIYGRS